MTVSTNAPARQGARRWAPYLVLAAVTLIVYAVSLGNGFVWDDDLIIVNNPQTLHLSGISDLLFAPDVVKPYYRPLNRATYLLNYWLTGMTPAGFHAVNILIHLGNVLLLYLVALRITSGKVAAFVAALFFAVHPINAEAVNFISGRNNLLALLFVLASYLLLLEEGARPGRRLFLSAVLFFLALLCKETGFMLIVLVALYILSPAAEGERRWGRLPSLLPYLLVAAIYLAMRAYALHGLAGGGSLVHGLWSRLAQNYAIIPGYLAMFVYPANLTVFHPLPAAGYATNPWLLFAWAGIIAAGWLLIRGRSTGALFGLLWLAVNYVPIANIVPIPSAPVAERYMYLPAVGLCLIVGEGAAFLSARTGGKRWVPFVAGVAALLLATVCVHRNLEWKDDVTLFSSAVASDPSSAKGHFNLGNALKEKGSLTAAEGEWEKALAIDPTYAEPLTQLGTLAAIRGDMAKAERFYLAALRSSPGNGMTHFNLGRVYEVEGKQAKAAEEYELAIRHLPVEYTEYLPQIEAKLAQLRARMAAGGAAPAQ